MKQFKVTTVERWEVTRLVDAETEAEAIDNLLEAGEFGEELERHFCDVDLSFTPDVKKVLWSGTESDLKRALREHPYNPFGDHCQKG